jgi:hypothetical protein
MSDPALAAKIVDRLNRARAGDPEALAQLEEKARTGIDPLVLAHDLDRGASSDDLAASRSSAAKKAWETRRAAGWVHPKSRRPA